MNNNCEIHLTMQLNTSNKCYDTLNIDTITIKSAITFRVNYNILVLPSSSSEEPGLGINCGSVRTCIFLASHGTDFISCTSNLPILKIKKAVPHVQLNKLIYYGNKGPGSAFKVPCHKTWNGCNYRHKLSCQRTTLISEDRPLFTLQPIRIHLTNSVFSSISE